MARHVLQVVRSKERRGLNIPICRDGACSARRSRDSELFFRRESSLKKPPNSAAQESEQVEYQERCNN